VHKGRAWRRHNWFSRVSNNCERAASGPGCKEKTSTERRTLAHCARALSGVLCARAAASNQAVGRTLSTSIVCVCSSSSSSSRVHQPKVSLCHCAPPEFTTCRPGCLPAAIIAANTERARGTKAAATPKYCHYTHTWQAASRSSLIPPDWFTRVMIVYIKCCDFIIRRCLKSSCHDTVNASAVNEGLCVFVWAVKSLKLSAFDYFGFYVALNGDLGWA
jgi:hypothetical protein